MPQPRYLERRGAGAALGVPVRHRRFPGVPAEGYELDITEAGVELRSRDESGRRYGLATLEQIRAQSDGRLPGLFVRDWPDFPVRGFMLDISRDRVPTRATLERLIGLMALARLNQLQLYTEHTFAYRDHEVVWRDASPITPDDVRWLDALCRDNGIELVPNQNVFGHMNRWLQHDAYRHRAEAPEGFEMVPGVTIPASVLAPTADNAAFAHGLLDELLPNFASRRVYVGCDEPFELGSGASRELVARDGRAAVYFEHLRRIVDPLLDRGYEVQFAADVVRHTPELLDRLPAGAVPLAWTYEAPAAEGDPPRVLPPALAARVARYGIDIGDHEGFAANVAPLADAGTPFWVLAGTSSWNSLVGRIDNAVANLLDAAEVGLDRARPATSSATGGTTATCSRRRSASGRWCSAARSAGRWTPTATSTCRRCSTATCSATRPAAWAQRSTASAGCGGRPGRPASTSARCRPRCCPTSCTWSSASPTPTGWWTCSTTSRSSWRRSGGPSRPAPTAPSCATS